MLDDTIRIFSVLFLGSVIRPFFMQVIRPQFTSIDQVHSDIAQSSESFITPSLRLTAEPLRQDITDQSLCAAPRHIFLEPVHDWLPVSVQIDAESVDFFCQPLVFLRIIQQFLYASAGSAILRSVGGSCL